MKTIEEAAKSAINANDYFMADPSDQSFVDRGLKQFRAMMWMSNHIMSLPLADRLTDEERQLVRRMYNFGMSAYPASVTNNPKDSYTCIALERIFGKAMFAEEGGRK